MMAVQSPLATALVLSGVCVQVVEAQDVMGDPLVTDRPNFTESAEVVPKGLTQVEGGYTLTRRGGANLMRLGEVLIRIGILPGGELRIGLNSFAWSDAPIGGESGFEDFSLGAKFVIHQPAANADPAVPQLAVLVGTTIPTGADAFGEDEFQPGGILAAAWELSKRVALGSNLGLGYPSSGGDRFAQFSGSVSVGVSVTDQVGAYGEYFIFAPTAPSLGSGGFLNSGLTLLVNNDFQLDGRLGVGIHGDDAGFFLGLGASRRF